MSEKILVRRFVFYYSDTRAGSSVAFAGNGIELQPGDKHKVNDDGSHDFEATILKTIEEPGIKEGKPVKRLRLVPSGETRKIHVRPGYLWVEYEKFERSPLLD